MAEPSADYLQCISEAAQHHASSKTYSGKFLRPHAAFIKDIIDRYRCESVLDYGCGKGQQYEWISHGGSASIPGGLTIEQYWGKPVTKYDPAWPPFAALPAGTFDLVICTHVLGSVPLADIEWVIKEILGKANKAVYFAEKFGTHKKHVFSRPEVLPYRWSRQQWCGYIRDIVMNHFPNIYVMFCATERFQGSPLTSRYIIQI